ncbi:MAG: HAD family hydrolase [Chloroflexi bacterium]|nr:HAD family hydrolase [Chloroflexota bacterium]
MNRPSTHTEPSGGRAKLVLFDIDGTLLHSGGAGRQAVAEALEMVYGRPVVLDGFRMNGKTDLQIIHELLAAAGLSEAEVQAGLPRLMEVYPPHLRRLIGGYPVRPCPGVSALLAALAGVPEAEMALLTGNMEGGARVKLEAAGLHGFFRWGVFGADARERSALPPVAVERAYDRTGRRYQGKEIVIIGDTPADILCGKGLGVRSIAVGTGPFTCAKLAAWEPDACFADLTPTEAVLQAILAP